MKEKITFDAEKMYEYAKTFCDAYEEGVEEKNKLLNMTNVIEESINEEFIIEMANAIKTIDEYVYMNGVALQAFVAQDFVKLLSPQLQEQIKEYMTEELTKAIGGEYE